ncbi:MAG: ATP-binding protein [Chloroflexota bacterium]
MAISRALTAELDVTDVLRIILQASVDFIAGNAGLIVLSEPNEKIFRVAAAAGIPAETLYQYPQLVNGLLFENETEREMIHLIDQHIQTLAHHSDDEIGINQTILIPMRIGDDLIGVIYVFQNEKFLFSQDAPNLLQSFADQAAIAVKNARLYEQIISEKRRLDAILEHSADGVMILSPLLNIEVYNQSMSQITGIKAKEAVGKHHDHILRWDKLRTDDDLIQAWNRGWPMPGSANLYVEGDIISSNGDRVSLGITYAPLFNNRQRVINIIANIRDLTRFLQEEELQKTFISVVSHELKTPVSIIKGYAGTLKRQDVDWPPHVQEEYLTVIEDEADQLTDLIDNLLEASRLQSGTFTLNLSESIDMIRLVENSAKKFRTQTSTHDFVIDFPNLFHTVPGDERRLNQVFNNLISNAIKYSPKGGTITISGKIEDNHALISVADEGIGIPAHQSHRIFQKFSRLDNDLSRKTEGTGLGLFLTKAIVEAHEGRIWFSSNDDPSEGKTGTTFTFSLPLNP